MKWRGRRQSSNIIDVRNITEIYVEWQFNPPTLANLNSKETIYINKDGATFGSASGSGAMIYIVTDYVGAEPIFTSGHSTSLRKVIKSISSNSVGQVSVKSKYGELQEIVSALIGNSQ